MTTPPSTARPVRPHTPADLVDDGPRAGRLVEADHSARRHRAVARADRLGLDLQVVEFDDGGVGFDLAGPTRGGYLNERAVGLATVEAVLDDVEGDRR